MSQKITIVPRVTGQPFEYELPDDVDAKVVGAIVKQAFEDGAEHATLSIMLAVSGQDNPYDRSTD